jgi:Flp pilus assembly pilin Flp
MLRLLRKNNGQGTAEYAILVALVVAAIVGMQTYVKRGLQGRYKDAGDEYVTTITSSGDWDTISGTAAGVSKQYEHDKLSSKSTQQVIEDKQKLDMAQGGTISRETAQTTSQAAGDYRKYDYSKE